MNVLVVLDKDGPNLFLENIVRELEQRHSLRIFAGFFDENSLRMFSDLKTEIQPWSACSEEDRQWADCVFCPVQSIAKVLHWDKYIFSFCNMNPLFDVVRGVDFVFTLNAPREQQIPYFASMPIGMPKNDVPPQESVERGKEKRFLFVDSGHFPFGETGKRQLAEMLLKVCRAYPDTQLWVKPRWMPGEKLSSMTHPNALHLYDVLHQCCPGGLPENLVLLQEHRNLQQLVDDSDCVITMCSTAYLDVALRNKPLVIVKGLDNEDMYQVRSTYFDAVYQEAEKTGCVVDYKDILSVLPEGRICDKNVLEHVFSHTTGASQRAVEVMEYVHEHYLVHGTYPHPQTYSYEGYREQLENRPGVDRNTIMANRFFCATGNCLAQNASISANIDWMEFEQMRMKMCLACDQTGEAYKQLRTKITEAKADYIIAHEAEMKNDVDRSYVYEAMYQRKRYYELLKAVEQETRPHETLHCYAGLIHYGLEQYGMAMEHLMAYADATTSRMYTKYITDHTSYRLEAYVCLLDCLRREKNVRLLDYLQQGLEVLKDYPPQWRKGEEMLCVAGVDASIAQWLSRALAEQPMSTGQDTSVAPKKKNLTLNRKLARTALKKLKAIIKKLKAIIKKRAIPQQRKRMKLAYRGLRRKLHLFNTHERQILEMKNRYPGQTCFIIGNGPSLRVEDLERIQSLGYPCFASNKIYKLYGDTTWRPDYYACTDALVFKQNIADILGKIQCPILLHSELEKYVQRYQQLFDTQLEQIYYTTYTFRQEREQFFPQAAIVESGGTVTFTMLEWAWMMGFRKIYLIGCDHSYGAFQNRKDPTQSFAVDASVNNDYCAKNYMRPGEKMNVGDLDKSTRGYAQARAYIEAHGGEIYNATRGGMLEVFQRADLDEVLQNKQEK